MRILQYTIISLVILFFSACSLTSPYKNINLDEMIENKYVSFKAPNTNWRIAKDYKQQKNKDNQTNIYNDTPKGASFSITIHTDLEKYSDIMTFKKNFDYEKSYKIGYDSQKTKDSYKEQGIYYAYSQTQYIKGMKCYIYVRAGENILKENGSTTKWYDTWCGYYDKTETKNDGRRRFRIAYKFAYSQGNQRLQKDKNTPSNEIKSRDELELQLKNEVKKLISTLKIKNFDKDKMIKEGLYHPSKKYENMKW